MLSQLPCFVPVLPLFHDDGIRACVEPVGMSTAPKKRGSGSKAKQQLQAQEAEQKKKDTSPACAHNSWDNVRVIKGQVTLRCRVCQVQWRTHVDAVWRKRKCGYFNTAEGCCLASKCPKLHLHARKQSLSERVDLHGSTVLAQVPVEAIPQSVKGDEKEELSPSSSTSSLKRSEPKIHSERPCMHNSWDNVRVKKGLVTLRCRMCQGQWRRPLENLPRCPLFPSCPEGAACPNLHLHAFKQSLAQRMGTHGETILQRVPPFVWSGPLGQHDVAVMCDGVQMYWPQALVEEGVRGWYDSGAVHRNVPEILLGGVLMQGPSAGVQAGSVFTVKAPVGCEVYVIHETGSVGFSTHPQWEAVTLCLARCACYDGTVTLPATEKANELFSIIVSMKQGKNSAVSSEQSSYGSCSSSGALSASHSQYSSDAEVTETTEFAIETVTQCTREPRCSTPRSRRSSGGLPVRAASCPPVCSSE
eukprot:TRINITY_DN336_c6_g1_i1.p1 TRINITY_DN336_c6_g1~~TRINITY_DN336_c6_g1_i1.p1  ORF type:complete len:473 (+),score=118.49 TRINITY_DN336_c6_g1_i1:87-1505(+)